MKKIIVICLLLIGCQRTEDDARDLAAKAEDNQYRIRSVREQRYGFVINIEGVKNKHLASIDFNPNKNEPVPEPGEIWHVEFNRTPRNALQLMHRIKEAH